MGPARFVNPYTISAQRWSWPTVERPPRRARWDIVGLTHRCAVGCSARSLPTLSNVPSTVSAMGAVGRSEGYIRRTALELQALGRLDVREAFIDGSFAAAKKRARKSGRRSEVKEPR